MKPASPVVQRVGVTCGRKKPHHVATAAADSSLGMMLELWPTSRASGGPGHNGSAAALTQPAGLDRTDTNLKPASRAEAPSDISDYAATRPHRYAELARN